MYDEINNANDLMNLVKSNQPDFLNGIAGAPTANSAITFAVVCALGLLALVVVALVALTIIGQWKTAKKLGGKGWSQVVPVYRDYEMARVAGCAVEMTVAYTALGGICLLGEVFSGNEAMGMLAGFAFLPAVVLSILVARQVARRFGKGAGFTAGLVLVPYVFYMILGCGKAEPTDDVETPEAPVAPVAPVAA